MRWEDCLPEEWTRKDGLLWRDMSWAERQNEMWGNPSLRRLLPTWFRKQRAKELRISRHALSQGEWLDRQAYHELQASRRG